MDTREKLIKLLIDSPSIFCTDEEFAETADCPLDDVMPVVRCKDCVHRKEKVCCNPSAGMWVGVKLKDTDFCSYGERMCSE